MALEHLFRNLPPEEREAYLSILRVQIARRRRAAVHGDSAAPATPSVSRTEKRCPRCDTVKPMDAFGLSTRRPDGRQGYCRPCRRRGM